MLKKHYYNQTPLYEANYSRLARLVPNTIYGIKSTVASGDTSNNVNANNSATSEELGIQLSLEILENHKYTVIARLTINLSETSAYLTSPAFVLRICHDVQVAEVIGYDNQFSFQPDYDYPNQQMMHRDEKHQVNRLLGELLDYFIHDKHDVRKEFFDQLFS